MTEKRSHPLFRMLASMQGHKKIDVVIDWWAVEIVRARIYRSGGYQADEAPLLVFYVEKDGKFSIDGDHMKSIAASIGQSLFGAFLRKVIK